MIPSTAESFNGTGAGQEDGEVAIRGTPCPFLEPLIDYELPLSLTAVVGMTRAMSGPPSGSLSPKETPASPVCTEAQETAPAAQRVHTRAAPDP